MRLPAAIVTGAILVASLAGCGHEIPDTEGHALFAAPQTGTGCTAGDERILHWYESKSPESNVIDTAQNLSLADYEYDACAKSASSLPLRGRYLVYAAISAYEAAIRYEEHDDALGLAVGAVDTATGYIAKAKRITYTSEIDIEDLLPLIDPDATSASYRIAKEFRKNMESGGK